MKRLGKRTRRRKEPGEKSDTIGKLSFEEWLTTFLLERLLDSKKAWESWKANGGGAMPQEAALWSQFLKTDLIRGNNFDREEVLRWLCDVLLGFSEDAEVLLCFEEEVEAGRRELQMHRLSRYLENVVKLDLPWFADEENDLGQDGGEGKQEIPARPSPRMAPDAQKSKSCCF